MWYFTNYIVNSNRIELLKETSHSLEFYDETTRKNILIVFIHSVCIIGNMEDVIYAINLIQYYGLETDLDKDFYYVGFNASCIGGHIDIAMMFRKIYEETHNISLGSGFSHFCRSNNTVIVESIIMQYIIDTRDYIHGLLYAVQNDAYDVIYLLLNKYSGLYNVLEDFDVGLYGKLIKQFGSYGNLDILKLCNDNLLNIQQIDRYDKKNLHISAFRNNYTDILDFLALNNIIYDSYTCFYEIFFSENINTIKKIIKKNRNSGEEILYLKLDDIQQLIQHHCSSRLINFIINNYEYIIDKNDIELFENIYNIGSIKNVRYIESTTDTYPNDTYPSGKRTNLCNTKEIINIYDTYIDTKYPNLDQDVKKYIITYIL